jgi:Protein of unknown function (DUF3429)
VKFLAPRDDQLPTAAMLLGVSGALPLLAGVAVAITTPSPFGIPVVPAVVVYAALILSFLGGMHWGLGSAALLREPANLEATRIFGLSILPPLAGWVAVFLPGRLSPAALTFAFLAVLILDRWIERLGYAPAWWMRLRIRLTAIVVVLLLLLAVAGPFG